MWSDGSVPGSTERNGIFHRTDDPFYHRYGRSPDYLDLWTVPVTQISDFLIPVLSGILDRNDHHAGDLLLVCKEEDSQDDGGYGRVIFFRTYHISYNDKKTPGVFGDSGSFLHRDAFAVSSDDRKRLTNLAAYYKIKK